MPRRSANAGKHPEISLLPVVLHKSVSYRESLCDFYFNSISHFLANCQGKSAVILTDFLKEKKIVFAKIKFHIRYLKRDCIFRPHFRRKPYIFRARTFPTPRRFQIPRLRSDRTIPRMNYNLSSGQNSCPKFPNPELFHHNSSSYWIEKNKDKSHLEQTYEIITLLSNQAKKAPLNKFKEKSISFDLKGMLS